MPVYTDQMKRRVEIPVFPTRIISLVPSQTELLYDLGCEKEIVGQTVFCVHPKDKFKSANKIGGTKKLKIKEIIALKPDLIIGNKEENTQEEIEELAKHFPVWMSDIYTLQDALEMIEQVGKICGKDEEAEVISQEISNGFEQLQTSKKLSCLYLIWRNPWMVAGCDTFINELLIRCGFENVCAPTSRYPELNMEEIISLNPQLVLLSSEPYPFAEKHIKELREILPLAQIKLVDGELFSWYGSRLRFSPKYFKQLLSEI